MYSPYDSYIDDLFLNRNNQQNSGFNYIKGEEVQPQPPLQEEEPINEQGIIADFVDKVQGGSWTAAADIITGVRGLLTDDQVWEMEQYLRNQAEAQNETLSQAQLEADQQGIFESPRSFMGGVASGVGSIVPSMLAGGLAGLAGRGLALKGAQALNAGDKASDIAGKVGTFAGGAAAGAPMIGGGSMNQVRNELDMMPNEELAQLPNFDQHYQAAIQQMPDDPNLALQIARDTYTAQAEETAVRQGAGIGGLSMGVAAPYLASVFKGGRGVLPGMALGAKTEALQEAFESGGQQAVVNPLVGRERFEGVPQAALEGAVLGGIVGGGVGGLSGAVTGRQPEENAPDDTQPAGDVPPNPNDYMDTQPVDTQPAGDVPPNPNDYMDTQPGDTQPVTPPNPNDYMDTQPVDTQPAGDVPPNPNDYMDTQPVDTQPAGDNTVLKGFENAINNKVASLDVIKQAVNSEVRLTDSEKDKLQEQISKVYMDTQPADNVPLNPNDYMDTQPVADTQPADNVPPNPNDYMDTQPVADTQPAASNTTEPETLNNGDTAVVGSLVKAGSYGVQEVVGIDNDKGTVTIKMVKHLDKDGNWNDYNGRPRKVTKAEFVKNTGSNPVANDVQQEGTLDEVAKEAATSKDNELPEPTEAQKEAGNYKKAHKTLQGMKVAIENPKGSERKGKDKQGNDWSVEMKDHYGYLNGTTGYDKDHIDVFMGPTAEQAESVYVVDQITPSTGKFDEHKVMMGYDSIEDAEKAYKNNYDKDWKGLSNITEMPLAEFKEWAYSNKPKKGALATLDDGMSPEAPIAPDLTPKAEPAPKPKAAPEPKAEPAPKPKAAPVSEAVVKAQNQYNADMEELGAAILDVLSMKAIPTDRKPEFTRLLTNVMGSALNLGYTKFTENAKYVLNTITEKFGKDAADLFDLQMLQGAYLGATSGEPGAQSINEVSKVTLDDINNTKVTKNGLHNNTDRDVKTGKSEKKRSASSSKRVQRADKTSTKRSPEKRKTSKPKSDSTKSEPDSTTSDRSGATEYQGASRADVRYNHTITSENELASGTAYNIAKSNIDAIKIAKRITSADNDTATLKEQKILAKYAGWGSGEIRNNVFPPNNKPEGRWKTIYDQLNSLLTPAEMRTLKRSTQTAFYTPKPIVDGMYKAVEQFGFNAGSIFEGGVGSGNFMGLLPKDLTIPAYTGVEMDTITADIAQALYPDNRVINKDFTKVNLPSNHFDLVIGNPPFADASYRLGGQNMKIHDYFIAKQLDALKPGKVGTFVTSTGTMDKLSDSVREYIYNRSVLIGAIRLPNNAFKGTGVTSDVLFFQKRDPKNTKIKGQPWLESKKFPNLDVNVNEYFIKNPQNMLGIPSVGGQFGTQFVLKPKGDTQSQYNKAIDSLPKDIITSNPTVEEINAESAKYEISPSETDSYFYKGKDGNLRIVTDGVGTLVGKRGKGVRGGKTFKQYQMIRDYIPLRDSLMKVMRNQDRPVLWKKAVNELNTDYDNFVKKHGPLNQQVIVTDKNGRISYREPVTSALEDDAEFYRVMTNENYNEDTNTATKSEVFTDRLFGKPKPVVINSAEDALSVTLNEKGYIDLDYMQSVYKDTPVNQMIEELGDSVYKDPVSDKYVTADDYLSGNVKAKLKQAKKAGIKRNIDALTPIIPADLPLSQIPINLGAFWISTDVIKNYATDILDFTGDVRNVIRGETSSWSVSGNAGNTAEFGTAERTPVDILNAALNKKTIRVTVKDNEGRTVLLVAESAAANEKVNNMKESFQSWVIGNPAASEELHKVYNRDFTTTVPRKYDGSMLTLPGLSSKYELHDWQKDVVWRIIQNGNTYMAHAVGSGKTLASIVAGQELKRLGLADKPTYVVLKATLKQFAAEYYDAYPGAKLLIADENQLSPRNRRHFMGKAANEQWDAIIMTHQSFEKIPMSDHFRKSYLEEQIDEYNATLAELDESDLPNRRTIESSIERMENELHETTKGSNKDKGITFEDSGMDHLFIDEAHNHKKVGFATAQNSMKSIDSTASNKATDLFLKSRYLNTIKPNKNLVLMSGTAVTNTINEFFNIQRYLQPDVLKQQGISSFDAWSSTFAQTSTTYEMKANGSFEPVTRLNKFVGLPGFLRDFLQVMDVVGDKQLEESTSIKNRPTLKNNSREIVAVPVGDSMKSYMKELDARIKAVEKRTGPPSKGADIIPVIIMDGANAAIDMRLVDRENDVPSKLDTMIEDAYQTYEETSGEEYTSNGEPDNLKGSTQLIFTTTRKTKHSKFDVYDHIKDTLVSKGVPEGEIAFIQDYDTSKKKKRLFKNVNDGKIRFVIGGTQNLGTGTNLQKRLAKIHHLAIDYRYSDLKQREGRIIRQGNQNEEVESKAYAAEGTIDAFMWGLLETKSKMIDDAMAGDLSISSIEDVGNEQSNLALAKAIASGNPALLQIAELSSDVRRLSALRDAYTNQRFAARRDIRGVERSKEEVSYWENQTSNLPEYKETAGDKFNAELYGKKYTDRPEFLDTLNAAEIPSNGDAFGKMGNIPMYGTGNKEVSFNPNHELVYIHGTSNSTGNFFSLNITPVRVTGDLSYGAVKRIENTARKYSNMAEELPKISQRIDKIEANADRLLNTEFDKTEELNKKSEQLINLEESLRVTEEDDLSQLSPAEQRFRDAQIGRLVTHETFNFTGLSLPAGLSSQDVFDLINKQYGRPLYGASKFKNLDIINDKESRWRGKYNPPSGKITLNAYYLTEEDAVRVLHHEKLHERIKQDIEFVKLGLKILKKGKKYPESPAGKAYQIAEGRLSQGEYEDYDRRIFEETMAYLMQYYNKPEIKSLLKKIIERIRAWFAKNYGMFVNENDALDYLRNLVQTEADSYVDKDPNDGIPTVKKAVKNPTDDLSSLNAPFNVVKGMAENFESDWFNNLSSKLKEQVWGILNVRQTAEVLGKYAPIIKKKYINRFKLFEADMNEMKQQAGDIAEQRRDLGRDENEKLAKIQHEATIAGYDPSTEMPEGTEEENLSGEDVAERRVIKYDYDKLSSNAKDVYDMERDYHKDMHEKRLMYLKNRINDVEGDEGFKDSMIDKLHEEFEKGAEKGPYFPLARFGRYWVSSERNGEPSFDMFENEQAQKRFVEMINEDPMSEVIGAGKKLSDLKSIEGVSGNFIADIDKLVRKSGTDPITEQLRDDIFQLYLETLPELSARKKYLHRGKVAGYSKDQSRAFAQKARADANDIARLKHIHVLKGMIDDTETTLNIASNNKLKKQFENHIEMLTEARDAPYEISNDVIESINRDAPFKAFRLQQTSDPYAEVERILNKEENLLNAANKIPKDKINFVANGLDELRKAHAAMVNNEVHPIASGLNSLGFLWYLGASPAAALVNLTQTPTIALPMMLASKKYENSARHLGAAMKDFIKGKGSVESQLKPDELEAFKEWHRTGLLENTQAHDLSGVADSGIDTGTFKNKAMRMISWLFHRAEVMNREVTSLAGYRAAKDAGASNAKAAELASDLTWNSHLDYGASNRARFMRGNTARVITQFKQYSQGITYIYAKTLQDSFKGESAEDKAQARKLFVMLMGSQLAVAGSIGLPMAGIAMGMAQGLSDALGDDDEVTSIKAEYRQMLSDMFGKTGGQALSHGLIDALTPLSASGRLSMADLWIRTPDYDQEGKAEALSYIEALGGPMVSLFTNMFMAKNSLSDGEYLRAAEQATPKFIKDIARSARYVTEGNLTKAGLKIKDMTTAEIMAQVLGFSSSEVSEIRELATQIKNVERKLTTRRKDLIDSWIEDRDMTEINEWNKAHPRDAISRSTLMAAIRAKKRYEKQFVKGVRKTKRNKDLIERYDY